MINHDNMLQYYSECREVHDLKRLKLIFTLITLSLLMVACGDKVEEADSEDVKEEIITEDGVMNAELTIPEGEGDGDFVVFNFDVDSDMKEEQAREIAEKYASKLQEKYEDMNIGVQALKDEKIFVQVTLERE